MHIDGPSSIHGAQRIHAPHAVQPAAPAEQAGPIVEPDQVDISEAARLASGVHELPPVREDLIARVRAAIAEGTYETPERLDVALDRLLDELG
jgi:negative regulator of flagellin synthesis FlgM